MELITYHLPTFVKHVLALKNEFGITKMTWRNYKSFGIRANPPPPMLGQIPKKCRFFLTSPLRRGVTLVDGRKDGQRNVKIELEFWKQNSQ